MADKTAKSITGLFKATLGGKCTTCQDPIALGDLIGFLKGYVSCQPCKNEAAASIEDVDTRGFL